MEFGHRSGLPTTFYKREKLLTAFEPFLPALPPKMLRKGGGTLLRFEEERTECFPL